MKIDDYVKRAVNTVFVIVFFIASRSSGFTSYYISSHGNDASSGMSISAPWKTISKVNAATFVSGDAIYFRAGDIFQGQINVNQSGVTVGAYGGSVKPIISGGEPITGWKAYRGSIYRAHSPAFVKNLYANGVQMTLARYPNSGFLKVAATNGTTTLSAIGLTQAPGYWDGGNLRVRSNQFTYETRPVVSYDGRTLTLPEHKNKLSGDFSYGVSVNYGFYLDNKLAALDTAGEWFCDSPTNMVYFYAPGGVNPASLTVIGSTAAYGVNSKGSNMIIQGLDFRYQAVAGIHFSGTTRNNRILSNTIRGANVYGVLIEGSGSNYTIDRNTLQTINGRGISIENAVSSTISNNSMKGIGLIPGYGVDHEYGGIGILFLGGSHNLIKANVLDSLGGQGIRANGSNYLIESNVITNVMLTLNDGGAINSYNEDGLSYAQTWRNNIIINVVGGGVESSNSPYIDVHGLYWDFGSHDMTAEGNTIMNTTSSGLFMQYACYDNTIRNNTFFNCGQNSIYICVKQGHRYGGNRVTGNTIYSSKSTSSPLYLLDLSPTYHALGTFDSNYYCVPSANAEISRVHKPSGRNVLDKISLHQWRMFSNEDAHSRQLYKKLASHERDTIIINPTGSTMMIALEPYVYHDVRGNNVVSPVRIRPYSSLILIRDTIRVMKSERSGGIGVSRQ